MRSETDTGSVNCPEMVQAPQTRLSGALLRRNGVESGPALLDFLAAAVRAEDFSFFVVDKRQDLGEEFLAIVAEEFVAGHTQPPRRRSEWKNSRSGDGRAQHGLAHGTSRFCRGVLDVQSVAPEGAHHDWTAVSFSAHFPTCLLTIGRTWRPVADLCREAPHRADLSATTRGRGVHTAPVASQRDGRHGAHARRALVARFTQSSTQCGSRGRTHCRVLHSGSDTASFALDDGHSQYVSGVPLVGAICGAARNSRFAVLAEAAGGRLGTCWEFLKSEI